jgi:predicted N-formylglutamate amidohydrolase
MADEVLPPVVRVLNETGASPFVLVCEHASNFIPERYAGLGLGEADLRRHIAWDIGAEKVARHLSQHLDAPLVIAGYSRLLIDLNRPPESQTAIPAISESTVIPGNAGLTVEQRQARVDTYFTPFQTRLSALLDARRGATKVIGVHSFTPVYKGVSRPWHAGILYRKAADFGHALAEALGGSAAHVAENQPYQIDDESDYTVPVHGEARGLDAVLIELRQDLVADDAGCAAWAMRLAQALKTVS